MARIRIAILLLLFSAAAVVEAARLSSLSSISSSDVWWHLSSGLWMLQNHALPRHGLFSQSVKDTWIASSWAYEVVLAIGYKLFDLRAIPLSLMCFKLALGVVTFLLAGGLRRNLWTAVLLSGLAQYILDGVQPGPTYVSILFFGVALLLLCESRRMHQLRPLFWLPPLMLVWANLDMQFVDGVALLLVFLGATAGERYAMRKSSLPLGSAAGIVGASIAATLVTPYFYRPYEVFFGTTFSSANRYLGEFLAMGFRQPQDYVLILLAMAAFLVLGLRRSRDLFLIATLAGCTVASFYSKRDVWLVTLAALAVIGEMLRQGSAEPMERRRQSSRDLRIAFALSMLAVIVSAAVWIPRSRAALLAQVGEAYPVAACDSIRAQHLAQPLFNAYEWGGFVTWYLPQYPVAIDGRNDLYGADFISEYSKVMNANVPYTEYPALARAQTILLPKSAIMAGAVSSLPLFRVTYSDEAAVVLTRNQP